MKYFVEKTVVDSHLAAKPPNRISSAVAECIDSLLPSAKVLDFGCGKLRYSIYVHDRVRQLTCVDSAVQLGRTQTIAGISGTLREHAERLCPGAKLLTSESGLWKKKYSLVLCVNVLSAIPSSRSRRRIVRNLVDCLAPRSRLLLSVQSRNSHYRRWEADPDVISHEGGLLKSRGMRGWYFAPLSIEELAEIVGLAGGRVRRQFVCGESSVIVASIRGETR